MLTDERYETAKSNNRWKIIAAVVAVVIVGVAGIVTWYLTRPAPQEVSLESAVDPVDAGTASLSDGLEGAWTMDASTAMDSMEEHGIDEMPIHLIGT